MRSHRMQMSSRDSRGSSSSTVRNQQAPSPRSARHSAPNSNTRSLPIVDKRGYQPKNPMQGPPPPKPTPLTGQKSS